MVHNKGMNSHDVRKLRICLLCKGLGIYKPSGHIAEAIQIIVCLTPDAKRGQRQFAHPRCYMEEMGAVKLLSLPADELSHIRLCDVPRRTMQLLLQKETKRA